MVVARATRRSETAGPSGSLKANVMPEDGHEKLRGTNLSISSEGWLSRRRSWFFASPLPASPPPAYYLRMLITVSTINGGLSH